MTRPRSPSPKLLLLDPDQDSHANKKDKRATTEASISMEPMLLPLNFSSSVSSTLPAPDKEPLLQPLDSSTPSQPSKITSDYPSLLPTMPSTSSSSTATTNFSPPPILNPIPSSSKSSTTLPTAARASKAVIPSSRPLSYEADPFPDEARQALSTEEDERMVFGFSTSQDVTSRQLVPAQDLVIESVPPNELSADLQELLAALGDTAFSLEGMKEDQVRASLDRVLRGEEEEEVTWQVPTHQEAVDREHLVFPDISKSARGDIVVSGTSRATSYFTDVPSEPAQRLSSLYAKSLLSSQRLLYLHPAGTSSHPYSLETRFKSGKTITNSIQEKLLSSYGNLVLKWLEWCEKEKISAEERFPADPRKVERWVSTLGGRYSPSWVRKHFNAISFWHSLHFLDIHFSDKIRRSIMRGVQTLAPAKKDKRRGITAYDILDVFEELDKEDVEKPEQKNRNLAIKACMSILFFGMGRIKDGTVERQGKWKGLGPEKLELRKQDIAAGLPPREFPKVPTFHPDYDASGSSFEFYKATVDQPPLLSFYVPHDKIKLKDGIKLQLPQQTAIHPSLDPVTAARNHVIANKPDADTPAFAYFGNKGQRRKLSRKEFKDRVNEALLAKGRPLIHGHSFRIGGNNLYRAAGINPEFVKPAGRWQSSTSYQIYARDAEKMSRKHLSNVVLGEEREDVLVKDTVEASSSGSEVVREDGSDEGDSD
ncbi:hypothetical protein JCM5353_008001 [Sporobolomyces roseus]